MKEPNAALVIRPIHEIEMLDVVLDYELKGQEFLDSGRTLQVRSQPSANQVSDELVNATKLRKAIKGVIRSYVDPINIEKSKLLELGKRLDGPFEEGIEIRKEKLCKFQDEQEEKQRQREEELRRKQEEERKRAEEEALEAQQKLEKAESEKEIEEAAKEAAEAEQKLEKSYEPPKPIAKTAPNIRRTAGGGSVSFRTDWKFAILDASQLPREYLMPDKVKIGRVVKAGVHNIAGVRIWKEKHTVTRTGRF